jgi:hypothetical protein
MNRSLYPPAGLLVFLLGAFGNAEAAIIYDNLPLHTYQPSNGATISGPTSGAGTQSHSESFAAGITANLSDIEIAMWHASGSTAFTLTLTDSSNNVLESFTGNAPSVSSSTPTVILNSILHPLLQAGQTYTLAATATGDTLDAWEFRSDTRVVGTSGFLVEGTAVAATTPEPASLALWSLFSLGCAVGAWRRRKTAA